MNEATRDPGQRRMRNLARLQGAFYVGTGIWSLLDIDSFEKVTGPKTDKWLVKTVGTLVTVVGGVLLYSANRDEEPPPEVPLLAAGSALSLAGIDTWYAAKGRISPVYLLDAAAEVGLAGAWAGALASDGHAGAGNRPESGEQEG